MLTCNKCRWWLPEDDEKQGECQFIGSIQAEKPETRIEIVATAADDTDLTCWLRTGPHFGCIHFAQ